MLLGDALWARSQGLELGIDLAVALSRSRASAEGDRQVPSPADLRLSENSTVPRYFGILVFWYFGILVFWYFGILVFLQLQG